MENKIVWDRIGVRLPIICVIIGADWYANLVCVWSYLNFNAPAGRPFSKIFYIYGESSCLPKVAYVLPRIDNAAKVEDSSDGRPAVQSYRGGTVNLLPAMLAQVGNQENVGNQNGNVVNENVQENIGSVIVNGKPGRVFILRMTLACNPEGIDVRGRCF
ncbi:hypothetical protein Tco_0626099 [Tanacetum coccineum]|uniref:Uncharacterized protein n=1 Tax=Tanacetum coccineum TaxID=301880 RepID=A0ABQ4WIQ2_9ASTR